MTEYKRSPRNAYANKAPARVNTNIALQLPPYIPAMYLYKKKPENTLVTVFMAAFAKLGKATIRIVMSVFVCLSARQSAWKSTPAGWTNLKQPITPPLPRGAFNNYTFTI